MDTQDGAEGAKMSNRERYMARLREKYPDNSYDDDEAIFGQANDDYDAYDKEIGGYKEREGQLRDMFTADPRSAAFLQDWRDGEDPVVGLIRKFGDDFIDALDDPDKQEALAEANKEYTERVVSERKYEEEYQKNIDETIEMLNGMQEEGYGEEELNSAVEFLVGIMRDGIVGRFSRESIDMALNALNHDEDVEQASAEGEIRGKNARVEETLRKRSRGDGMATLDGGGAASGGRPMPDMGALDRYDNSTKDIWERGGERRRKNRY